MRSIRESRVRLSDLAVLTVERIDEAFEVRGKELTAEEEKYLEELYEARNVEGHQ
jgi:hypothetical protein